MQREGKWFALAALGVALGLSAGCAKSSGTDCGNGRIDGAEQCDGAELSVPDCSALGLGVGPLKCNLDCTFDLSACPNASLCGNGAMEGAEYCDGLDLGGQTCDTLNLGTGTLGCLPDCSYDTSGCSNSAVCGNGVVEGPEQCDGFNLNGQSCATLGQGWSGGELACNTASCLYNTDACTLGASCGNGIREGTEECDGTDLNGVSCVTLGFAGGNLTCSAACTRDTSGCTQTAENCVNGVDDDGDGAIDCNDLDCSSNPACGGSPENCTNGIDDDQDGFIDCDDQVDCSSDPSCQTTTGEICDNGIDDDGAWGCDCTDLFCTLAFVCWLAPSSETNCTDGVDDDLDCEVDCADADCATDPACGGQVEICDNGTDDDADGDTDCDDSDCVGHAACPVCTPTTAISCGDTLAGNTSGGINNLEDWDAWCSAVAPDSGPESYFIFSHTSGGSVTAELSINGTDDLDLLVVGASGGDCDPTGACVDYSQSTTSTETIDFTASAGDTYYIIVDGYNGASGSFSLSVTCN